MMLKVIKGDDETFDVRIYIDEAKYIAIEQDADRVVVLDAYMARNMIKALRKMSKKLAWRV